MSDLKSIIKPNTFSAAPKAGQGALALLKALQVDMKKSIKGLNPAQKIFVNAKTMDMAKKLGWLDRSPVILKDDSLTAGETGITLKQGKGEKKIPYKDFLDLSVKPKAKEDKFVVVVGAGHGGKDSGAIYPAGLQAGDTKIQVKEEDLTLALAKKLELKLKARNIEVKMLRREDTDLSRTERVKQSNDFDPDLFVSIHTNSVMSPKPNGFEVYVQDLDVYKGVKRKSQEERIARSTVAQNFIAESLKRAKVKVGDRSSNTPKGNFQVIRETEAPAVLVETGFISNATDRISLMDKEYQDRLVSALAEGIDKFIRQEVKVGD